MARISSLVMRLKAARLLVGMTILSQGALFAATIVSGYDPEVNDRFENSASFLGAGYDWSGVGQTSSGAWATMISGDYFVSAEHLHPGGGQTVRFYYTNDPAGGYEERVVDGSFGMALPGGNGDIWIGRLTTSISSAVTFYNIFDTGGDIAGSIEGQSVFTVGLAGGSGYGNFRVGLNEYDVTPSPLNPLGLGVADRDTTSFGGVVDNWSGSLTYLEDNVNDTYYQSGDSGAPSFIYGAGVLNLVGIHSEIYDVFPSGLSDGDFSMDSLVSAYRAEILALITPVPEPGTMLMVMLGLGLVFRRRR